MYTADYIAYIILASIALIELFMIIYCIEYIICAFILHQPPFVPTNKNTRKLIVQTIKQYYPHTKSVCEIGSGYGTLARLIGKHTNAKVIALENMPFSALLSKILDRLQNKSKTIKTDAFEYLAKTKRKFDIGIAYLSPEDSNKLLKYKNKIKTLITIDFAIDKIRPTKIIDAGRGYTKYNHKLYPHKIFIYKFQ